MIRDSRFHRGSDAQGLVNAAKIVVHKVSRDRVNEIVDRASAWRIVRFWRSRKLVEMPRAFGFPEIGLVRHPIHSALFELVW
jgi:hypothetical protein